MYRGYYVKKRWLTFSPEVASIILDPVDAKVVSNSPSVWQKLLARFGGGFKEWMKLAHDVVWQKYVRWLTEQIPKYRDWESATFCDGPMFSWMADGDFGTPWKHGRLDVSGYLKDSKYKSTRGVDADVISDLTKNDEPQESFVDMLKRHFPDTFALVEQHRSSLPPEPKDAVDRFIWVAENQHHVPLEIRLMFADDLIVPGSVRLNFKGYSYFDTNKNGDHVG